jgi:type IV pilus secretin PilQ/predicted competence protein
MISLSRERRYRLLLTSFALIILACLLSLPARASNDIAERKLHRLEVLGLDVQDPTIRKAADSAHALHSVNVIPKGENINVVIQLSELPSYKSSIYEDRRRMVVDLYNTINISPSAELMLSDADPIRMVRNAQFKVTPSIISRVVLELDEEVTPEIVAEGNSLVISAPSGGAAPALEVSVEAAETEVVAAVDVSEEAVEAVPSVDTDEPGETIAVPTVDVETNTPEIDIVVAQAATEEETQPAGSAAKEVEWAEHPPEASAQEEVEPEPAVLEMEDAIEALISDQDVTEPVEAEVEEVVEEDMPAVEEAEEAPAEIIEPVEMEIEPEPVLIEEPTPTEEVEVVEAEEAAKALNGMFSEMVEPVESSTEEQAEPVEPMPEDMGKLFGEMFEEMASMMGAETTMDPAAEEGLAVAAEEDPSEMLMTLAFRDAELNAVLDIIARKGNLNIIAGKEVKGSVTVRLVDVPLDVALNAILNVNGYGYLKTDNIIRILPLSEIGEVVNMSTETYRLSYAKAEAAKKTLGSFLTGNGSIEVDERTNILVVTDVPANKDRMEKLIHEIDRRVQQVLIEVIILDSVLSDDADLGVSWGLLNTNDNSPNSKEAARLEEEDPFPDQFGITLPTGANALNVVFGTMFDDLDLNIFIDAVVSDSEARVLANPKILTLNNELATIEIIQEFPYNDVTQTSSGGQLSNITFKEIGTKLEVKPQITHDEHVILWLSPEQNSIAGTTTTGVPVVDTRKAETTLIVKNHQTIVMGGLRENRNVNSITKVPFFGDLPGVKYAFRSVQSDKADSELLVFLTVHIVESPVLLPEERIKAEELANLPRNPNSTIELIRP